MQRSNGGFSVDNLFNLGADSTPKRSRPAGGAASAPRPSHLSSSPLHAQHTPNARPTPGPSRLNGASPASSLASPATPAAPAIPFSQRPDKLTLQESLNDHLPLPTSAETTGSKARVALSSSKNPADYDYRIAYERAMDRSEVLDNLIDEAAEIFRRDYGIDEFGDPGVQSQEEIIAVGRLCAESDTAKMTETASYLESSRSLGSGHRVLLKFEPDCKVRGAPYGGGGAGLVPGCMVGLKGINGGGKLFAVKEIIMMPPIDPHYTAPSELLAYQYGNGLKQLNGSPMSVIVAAGPYTVESDLDYEPLDDFLGLVKEEKPDVLVMLGPFIDASHPSIAAGEVDEFPTELFRSRISSKLVSLLGASPRTQALLIPHGRDLTNAHVAYPQAPFRKDDLGLPKGVRLLPNPTSFDINEVSFGLTSVDVFWSLKTQEFFKRCPDAEPAPEGTAIDPLAKDINQRAGRHLLRQRSFYPIFPSPPAAKRLDGLNLDITHYDLVKMTAGPDILIAPSMQRAFSRTVDSVIMINPSFLVRDGSQPGTFARLTIHPLDKDNLNELAENGMVDTGGEADEPVEHRVWERCRVDLIKV
ncbi:DNA-directed DNA polymerase alpha subunit POL12 [Sporobolomyces salmoneus]|uniref:DNA-directed DNA polymerase alpha subunit POL12 n=1 Tax=Sporobolomyces salmoneus TaxID=183962 RepID=UPI003173BDEC